MPSVLDEVDFTYPLVDTEPAPNTPYHLHVVFTALLLMGCTACTKSIAMCELIGLLCYAAIWVLLQANLYC